jgi:signal transduction histidine kinase/DNA-binding response OmpR family regulator
LPALFAVALLPLLTGVSSLAPAQSISITDTADRIQIGRAVSYYEDQSGSLQIEDVLAPGFRNNFIPNTRERLHFGLTSSVYWIAFDLDWSAIQPGVRRVLEIGPPKHVVGLSRGGVDIFMLDADDNIVFKHQLGSLTDEREIQTLAAGYALRLDARMGDQVYLRVSSTRPLLLPLTLWQESAFHAYSQSRNNGLGIFYGILIAMALYNLFLYASIREVSFLYYVLTIGTQLGFMFLDSKHLRFLTGNMLDQSVLVNLSERLIYPALLITTLLFQRALLNVADYNRHLDRVILFVLGAAGAVAVLALLPSEKPYQYLFLTVTFFTIPLAFYINVDAIRNGVLAAVVHLTATSVFLAGATLLLLRQLWGDFPDNTFTANAYSYGIITQALLLSFGLAFRYNQIKQEKEDAQQLAIQNLIRSEQVKDDLLANVSHELRTPLYGINGLAETALREYREGHGNTDLMVKNLELILSSGDRLTKLVNDLLDFSSFKDDTSYIKLKPVDLNSLINLVIAVSKPLLGDKRIDLRCDIDPDLPLVDGDEDRLQQVLLNLVSNAIKFTYAGEVVITARLTEPGLVTVAVRDTGIGIHETDQDTIFRSFEKVATPSVHGGGGGLGLPIAKRMIEMHGSQLNLQSELDMGSTFSFTLRVSKNQTRAVPTPTVNRQMIRRADFSVMPDNKTETLPKLRSEQETTILIVDDDEVNLTLMGQQLDEYTVIKCSNGFDAITQVDEQKPDLVLLDLMMPGMNGYEVCQKLRQRYNQIELPIILVTAKNHLEDLTMGFNTGANDYLAKPYYFQELKSRVNNQLKLGYLHRIHDDNVRLRSQIERYAQADAELRSSRFHLQQVLESVSSGFIAFEYPGKVFSLNDRAAQLLGTDRDTLLGCGIETLFTDSPVNDTVKSALSSWDSGEQDQASVSHVEVEVGYPYNNAGKSSSKTITFKCRLHLFSTEQGTGALFFEDGELPNTVSGERIAQNTVELISLLGQAQHNIRRISTRLSVLTPQEISRFPELLDKLMGFDGLVRFIDEKLPEVSSEGEYRQQLVTLMRSALHTWEVTTQKFKIELAEESNIWAVSIDDGRLRTRTFDRYLRLEQLPKIPRWREVVRTAYFVLSNPAIEPETRATLESELEKTKAILKKAAIS